MHTLTLIMKRARAQALSTFYLAAYLASLQEQGYTIFVVRSATGNWDSAQNCSRAVQEGQAVGRWYTADQV